MKKNKNIINHLLLLFAIISISMAFIGCDAVIETGDPPVVSSTFPVHESTGTDISGTVSATFNMPMDSTSITSGTFTVSTDGTPVAGVVTYDVPNMTATFAPTTNLANMALYTATLTTGVKNLAGIEMVAAKEWTFTTAAAGAGPSPVNLGTAANYAILAKTAISTVPASVITGNVGLSPAATSYITGFALTDDTGYATSAQVTGFVYAADMVTPTSENLTTAVADMIAAYNDAVGRATPDYLELGAGEIGGLDLAPGLYKWTSSVTIGSNTTINGGANDIWIFQISGDLDMASDLNVTLSGGAQAKNIIWQVAGKVTLDTGAHFEGIVLTLTEITLNTGSSINGRLLAQTQIALDQATVTKPVL